MVLLIVDTQKAMTNQRLYQFETFVSQVKELIRTAREQAVEVIYVRHDDGPGGEVVKGTPGFEIYEEFQPAVGEKILDKTANSAFLGTGLADILTAGREDKVIVAGLQTEYCIDATVKSGFERGFQMIVPASCTTTVDNAFLSAEDSCRYNRDLIWDQRYALCVSFAEALELLQQQDCV